MKRTTLAGGTKPYAMPDAKRHCVVALAMWLNCSNVAEPDGQATGKIRQELPLLARRARA